MRQLTAFFDFFLDRYPSAERLGVPVARWRQSIYRMVFDARTPMGKQFERYLTFAIICSLLVMMAHSIPTVAGSWMVYVLRTLEVLFTLAFTVEYALRIISVRRPWRYVFSFYGIVDLLAIVPTYLSFFYDEASFFAAIRALRLVRTFHIFPVLRGFLHEYQLLGQALRSSARKIFVFLSVVALIVFVMGSLIFIIEGPENGFTSVPTGIYWAISTVTTVGYGDLTPGTPIGQVFASIMMLLGWGILAVPTGLVGAELSRTAFQQAQPAAPENMLFCDGCGLDQHDNDARFCRHCGARLVCLDALARQPQPSQHPATQTQPASTAQSGASAPTTADTASQELTPPDNPHMPASIGGSPVSAAPAESVITATASATERV